MSSCALALFPFFFKKKKNLNKLVTALEGFLLIEEGMFDFSGFYSILKAPTETSSQKDIETATVSTIVFAYCRWKVKNNV